MASFTHENSNDGDNESQLLTKTSLEPRTVAQKQRKRELDRRSQRMARERTKSRIAYLEGLVQELSRGDASETLAGLARQLSSVRGERDTLIDIIRSAQRALDHSMSTSTSWSPQSAPNADQIFESDGSLHLEHLIDASETMPGSSHVDDHIATSLRAVVIANCACSGNEQIGDSSTPFSLWKCAKEILKKDYNMCAADIQHDESIGQDLAVRATIEGWTAVEAKYPLSELGQRLRAIDKMIFSRCGPIERIAIMRLMHLMLQHHARESNKATETIPVWYRDRPSQSIPHSHALDFFPWPGIRERFIFFEHLYCSNLFWDQLVKHLRIDWSHEVTHCYTFAAGSYSISPMFERRITDISTWTMRAGFFEHFPDLRADIPICGESSTDISDTDTDDAFGLPSATTEFSLQAEDHVWSMPDWPRESDCTMAAQLAENFFDYESHHDIQSSVYLYSFFPPSV